MARRRPAPLQQVPGVQPASGIKEKYQQWMSAWGELSPQAKEVLSAVMDVGVMHRSAAGKIPQQPGKIAILPTVPFMLYWYVESNKKLKHQFNFVEAFLKGKAKIPGFGLYVGKAVSRFIDEIGDFTYEIDKTVVISLDFEELWLSFPSSESSNRWKKSVSSLLKPFIRPFDPRSPLQTGSLPVSLPLHTRKSATITETLGLIFDITANDKSDDSNFSIVWTSIKVTFLQSSGHTNEEYFLFDKSQGVLEVSCEEILVCLRDKLDAGNMAIVGLFLQEMSVLLYEKRRKQAQNEDCGWVFRDLHKPELLAFWESDYKHILQQYSRCDPVALHHLLTSRITDFTKPTPPQPLSTLFTLCNLHNLALKFTLSALAREENRPKEITRSISQPILGLKEANSPGLDGLSLAFPVRTGNNTQKWYKEACDCSLF